MQSTKNNYKVDINVAADCETENSVYLLECAKCLDQYVGTTQHPLKERFKQHKGYVTQNLQDKATGFHFNQPGHSTSDMRITIIEKVFSKDVILREQREQYYINKFEAKSRGMNRKNG